MLKLYATGVTVERSAAQDKGAAEHRTLTFLGGDGRQSGLRVADHWCVQATFVNVTVQTNDVHLL